MSAEAFWIMPGRASTVPSSPTVKPVLGSPGPSLAMGPIKVVPASQTTGAEFVMAP